MKPMLAIGVVWISPCFAQVDYTLKPLDRILVHDPQNKNINGRTFQIHADGFIALPSLGRVRAGGVNLSAFEKDLANRLKRNGSTNQVVSVSVVALREPSLDQK
jgi:protein involved in polysaccharide export with SLBB domain